MPRPPRIEYEGAFHHVMNRGRDSQTIYWDDEDYVVFLGTLAEVTKEYHAVIHAYCLMTNHYHLLIETPKANLSQIMKQRGCMGSGLSLPHVRGIRVRLILQYIES